MPLPDLPPNNTIRVWLKYTWMLKGHEICFRQPDATASGDVIANANDLAQALKPFILPTDAFTSLRWSQPGSNLSFPLAFTAVAGTGAFTPEADDVAKFVSIVGRSTGGYRCRMTLFTGASSDAVLYRIAGSTFFDTAVNAMEPPAVAIDGNEVIWNNYTNVGYNSYWQREVRQ